MAARLNWHTSTVIASATRRGGCYRNATKFPLKDENQRAKAKHTKRSISALSIQVGSVLPQSVLILIAMIKYLALLAYKATVLFKFAPADASFLQSCTRIT